MKLKTTSVIFVLMWLLVLSVGCGQQPERSQGQGNSSGPQSDNRIASKGGKAPHYLEISLTPQQQEYKQAEAVTFTIKIKNVWKESLHIANTPTILVGPATTSTIDYDSIAIPDLSDKTLKPGETLRSSGSWTQSGEPGWYQVEFGDIDLGDTTLGGGGSRFFVKYPPDKVQTKMIESGAEMKLPTENGDLTFVLKRIEMNENDTKVYFDFNTDLDAPMGFQMSLARSNDYTHPEPALGVEQSQQNNGTIEGMAKFNPITNDVTKLALIISDWSVIYKGVRTDTVKGPWIIDVLIK